MGAVRLLQACAVCALINLASSAVKRLAPIYIPENRQLKQALGYHEDTYLTFPELTAKYGYPTQEHVVTTEDGYILKLFRLADSKKCQGEKHETPVLLMHGLFDSGDSWILPKPKTGLAYILADACYDVWVANHRGNVYSRKHVKMNPDTDPAYWNFSFHEHGIYDLPAFIDHILKEANTSQLFYVGHSQGTTDFFALGSTKPEYNEKIKLAVHLAPVAWLTHVESSFIRMAATRVRELKNMLDSSGFVEIFARSQLMHNIVELLCSYMPKAVCGMGMGFFTGYKNGISDKTMSVAFGHWLSGESTKSLAHFGHIILAKDFVQYDEGKKQNLKKYGSKRPPAYDLSKVTSPTVLICGQNDLLSSTVDTKILSSKLPNVIDDYMVPDPDWSHANHLWAKTAPKYVFSRILKHFNAFSNVS